MTALGYDLATARVLVRRDLTRFFRQPSRLVGALGQPILFWLIIGSGMAATFRMPGAEGVGYLAFFYPGVVLMVVLFAAIFTTVSVIEDQRIGGAAKLRCQQACPPYFVGHGRGANHREAHQEKTGISG